MIRKPSAKLGNVPPKPPTTQMTSPTPSGSGKNKAGAIGTYIHSGNQLGVLMELQCGTDLVAISEKFLKLLRELCVQVAGGDPKWISRNDVPGSEIKKLRKSFEQEAIKNKIHETKRESFVDRQMERFFSLSCLLEQPYVADSSGKMLIKDLLLKLGKELGEEIVVSRFARYRVGAE